MANDKTKVRFLSGADYLSKTGWQRAEVGDVCAVGTGAGDVLPRTAEWLCKADAAEWVRDDKPPFDSAAKVHEWGTAFNEWVNGDKPKGKETNDDAKSG